MSTTIIRNGRVIDPESNTDAVRHVGISGGVVRAVGAANGRNPLPIVLPCHRVIASDGTLGGYGGGLALKQRLLDLERGQAVLLPASAAS